jgi:hypothetical protein
MYEAPAIALGIGLDDVFIEPANDAPIKHVISPL